MKRNLALVGRSALAGVVLAVAFCAGLALFLGGAAWWFTRHGGANDGAVVVRFETGGGERTEEQRREPVQRREVARDEGRSLGGSYHPRALRRPVVQATASARAEHGRRGGGGGDEGASFVETFVAGVDDAAAAKVVRVEITGEIGPPPPSPVGDLLGGALGAGDARCVDAFNAARDRIHLATDEKDVKGLFLVIDSPGGDLTDCDILWHDVQLFRKAQSGRFVFVHALAQCCSGGYYVAAAADFIMVLPTSVVGSIGIISDYGYNVSDLARHFGVSNVVVTTGEHKDALNPFKPVDPRQIAIEQGLVDSQFKRFVQVIAEGRKLSVERVRELADGRAYAAEDAVEKKLADAVGYEEDAMAKLRELAGGDVCVVAYDAPPEREESFLKKLFGGKSNGSSAPSARRRHRGLSVPRLRLIR